MNPSLRTVSRIAGTAGVCSVLAAILVFASGYAYDVDAGDFVKRGVVYFEGIESGEEPPEVFMDGELVEDFSAPGEIRVEPGSHRLEIRLGAERMWQKEVKVPEDRVVRFATIQLRPLIKEPRRFWSERFLENLGAYDDSFFEDGRAVLVNHNLKFRKIIEAGEPESFVMEEIIEEDAIAGQELHQKMRTGIGAKIFRSVFPLRADGGRVIAAAGVKDTFHSLMITSGGRLLFCDRDGENCSELGMVDRPEIAASEDGKRFLVIRQGGLRVLDFGEPSALSKIFAALGFSDEEGALREEIR